MKRIRLSCALLVSVIILFSCTTMDDARQWSEATRPIFDQTNPFDKYRIISKIIGGSIWGYFDGTVSLFISIVRIDSLDTMQNTESIYCELTSKKMESISIESLEIMVDGKLYGSKILDANVSPDNMKGFTIPVRKSGFYAILNKDCVDAIKFGKEIYFRITTSKGQAIYKMYDSDISDKNIYFEYLASKYSE